MYSVRVFSDFSSAHVPSANTEGVGFVTDTTVHHQGAITMLWVQFWGAVVSSFYTPPPNCPFTLLTFLFCLLIAIIEGDVIRCSIYH